MRRPYRPLRVWLNWRICELFPGRMLFGRSVLEFPYLDAPTIRKFPTPVTKTEVDAEREYLRQRKPGR